MDAFDWRRLSIVPVFKGSLQFGSRLFFLYNVVIAYLLQRDFPVLQSLHSQLGIYYLFVNGL